METPRTRVVSYKEYLLHCGLQAVLNLGLLLMGLTFFAGVCLMDYVLVAFIGAEVREAGNLPLVARFGLLLAASLCLLLGPIGWDYLRRAYERQPPVQLLRGCTAVALPLAESLLRASDEPVLWQKTALLRATSSPQEISTNHLLRPTLHEET
jgi:hypothetical protein